MHKQINLSPAGASSQAEAVVRAAEAWLARPLGERAGSQLAFVRNRADEVLPLADARGAAAVYAVLVANYDSWDEDLRNEPLEVQAATLALLLSLERKLRASSSVAQRLARPLEERARAIRSNADALERRIRREAKNASEAEAKALLEKAAKLRRAAEKNAARGLKPVAESQQRQAEAMEARAAAMLGGEHPLAAQVRTLREKEAQVRAQAARLRRAPSEMAANVREAIAQAIAPEVLTLLGRAECMATLRIAVPLSDEWYAFAVTRMRFASASAALLDAWAQLAHPSANIQTVLRKLENRLFLRRTVGDLSLLAPAPETVARELFPRQSPFSITVEMAMTRLIEELRRVTTVPAVSDQLLEKIERLSAYAEATGDRAAVSKLHELQHQAALAELKAERRAAQAFARRKAAKQLRVRTARRLAQRV